jgi:uncharacterized protein (TIGR02145 family)
MKKLSILIFIFFIYQSIIAQDIFLNPSGGNVGIGTNTATSRLVIKANSLYNTIEDGYHGLLIGEQNTGNHNLIMGADNVNNISYIESIKRYLYPSSLILNPRGSRVGIGTVTPHNSAVLDVSSTRGGFLPPRMTMAERNFIPSPAAGLTIWNTTCSELQVFDGTSWKNMTGGIACSYNGPTVQICGQIWMLKNLDASNYRNGDPIPHVTNLATWASLTTGAWCYYVNNSGYGPLLGKLYNWYAVTDPRGLAPEGWHIPNDFEWQNLGICLGGDAVAGGKMKETGFTYWTSPNFSATNTSGFTGRGGGYIDSSAGGYFDKFSFLGLWWSSTSVSSSNGGYAYLQDNSSSLGRTNTNKTYGFYVRCIKD